MYIKTPFRLQGKLYYTIVEVEYHDDQFIRIISSQVVTEEVYNRDYSLECEYPDLEEKKS